MFDDLVDDLSSRMCVCSSLCVDCHVLEQGFTISIISDCNSMRMTCVIKRLLTYLYLMSTVFVLCDYNENIFVCSYVVCAVQIHCHVVYMQGVPWCFSALR